MTTSTVPACIDALVTLFTSACAPAQVFDGQPVGTVPDDFVAVAIADGDNPSVEWAQDWASLGHNSRSEDYTIRCMASCWSGAGTMKATRDRAWALAGLCMAAVNNNPGLSATQPFVAQIVGGTMTDAQTDEGPVCTIPFNVAISNSRISGS